MKGTVLTRTVADQSVSLYLPEGQPQLLILLAGESDITQNEEQITSVMTLLEPALKKGELSPFVLASPAISDWDAAYAPWPAQVGERAFGGQADAYLDMLEGLYPALCREYHIPHSPQALGFAGYSLAGLTAIYAALHRPCFGRYAGVSGSLWYPGWMEHLQAHINKVQPPRRVYLSLGKAEVKTRSPLMRSNKDATEQTAAHFAERLGQDAVTMVWNNGNHFFEIPNRLANAIRWLISPTP